jgi:hypothetical protein
MTRHEFDRQVQTGLHAMSPDGRTTFETRLADYERERPNCDEPTRLFRHHMRNLLHDLGFPPQSPIMRFDPGEAKKAAETFDPAEIIRQKLIELAEKEKAEAMKDEKRDGR